MTGRSNLGNRRRVILQERDKWYDVVIAGRGRLDQFQKAVTMRILWGSSKTSTTDAGFEPGCRLRIGWLVLLVSIAGCSGDSAPVPPPARPEKESTGTTKKRSDLGKTENDTAAGRKGNSKAPPVMQTIEEFELSDQAGRRFNSSQLEGKVWLASFAGIDQTEPGRALATRLARLQRQFEVWPDGERVALVTFHPANGGDDRGGIVDSMNRLGVVPNGAWTILSGDDEIRQRVVYEGFRLVRPTSPDVENTQLALVDPQGRVRGFYDGLAEDSFRVMLAQMRTVLNEPTGTGPHTVHKSHPDDLFYAPWMEDREAAQREANRDLDIRQDFTFEDRLAESGIAFVNRAVADSTRDWKLNHYDHANGLAVADVDGDGRLE